MTSYQRWTLHGNHRPISYPFRDKRRFQSKIAKKSHPRVLCAHAEGLPLELGIGAGGQKTRMMGLWVRERSLTIYSAVWIQYTNVTDKRTDTGRQQRPRLRVESRGKKNLKTYKPKTWKAKKLLFLLKTYFSDLSSSYSGAFLQRECNNRPFNDLDWRSTVFHFYFFGSCSRLSWLNCQLSSAR